MARLNQNRSKLLLGCGSAALAIGLAAAPERAEAQAFQATEVFVDGAGNRVLGSGTETITIDTPTAIIEWTPDEDGNGNALDFLPTGNTATFQNGSILTDFTVLNIVLPSTNGNVTVFDGTVISQLIDPQTGGVTPGGTLVFYSPSGILVGGNAVFDVGNLILTTLDPTSTFSDWAGTGQTGSLDLGGTPTTANIIISPGAQVIASAENSYFAVTAAEVQMFGTSLINGSQAYVAGQAVSLTVSNGLFDIQIPVGTDSLTPVVFGGDVGGPSSTGLGDNHLIYAVARANNDPISMLFSGNLGFAPAASAGIVNGEIILAANYDVFGRTVDGGAIDQGINALFNANSAVTDVAGSIFLEDFASSSSILAIANEEVQVTAFNGPSFIDGNLLMVGRNFSELTSSNGQLFDITGDVYVSADAYGTVGADLLPGDTDATAGTAFIDAFEGGTLNIGGNVTVSASAVAGSDISIGNSGAATGGSAAVASTGGALDIAGTVEVLAIASEAQIGFDYFEGGTFNAGSARVFASDGGLVTLRNDVTVIANANGTVGDQLDGSTASNAFGGFASVDALGTSFVDIQGNLVAEARANAGTSRDTAQGGLADAGTVSLFADADGGISVINAVTLRADAFGGTNSLGQGGNALGGAARAFTPAGGTINIGGDFEASSAAFGGAGTSGGDATAGTAGIEARIGLVDVAGSAISSSIAQGGDALFGFGGAGGNAIGGLSFLQATGTVTASATLNIGGSATVESNARGGTGGLGDGDTIAAGRGGDGTAGQFDTVNQADTAFNNGAFVLGGGDNGNLSIGLTTNIFNFGIGGDGGNGGLGQAGGDGGTGTGGTAQAGQALLGGDGSVGAGVVNFGDVFITANGDGGNGGFGGSTGDPRGNGGDGNGFGAFFTARVGNVVANSVSINADGTGGVGQIGGIGSGGFVSAQISLGGSTNIASLEGFAIGRGGEGEVEGGAGQGGEVEINLNEANFVINDDMILDAGAFGGGVFSGLGGVATGGLAEITIDGDTTDFAVTGNAILRAFAQAAQSDTASQGALATGGQALVSVISQGSAQFASLSLESGAQGGDNLGSGQGGDAIGGRGFAIVDNGGSLTATDFTAFTSATGGAGVGGGDGFGGIAGLRVLWGSALIQTSVFADATGIGGNSFSSLGFGGDGGIGTGGYAAIIGQGTQTQSGAVTVNGDVTVVANGVGGAGGFGDGSTIAAGSGGDGVAGIFTTNVAFDPAQTGGAVLLAGGDNGSLDVGGNAVVQATGFAGNGGSGGLGQNGGNGGNAFGGSATAGVQLFGTDGTVALGTATLGNLIVEAGAVGGSGGFGGSITDIEGIGGDALGGRALVSAGTGSLVAGNVTTEASGTGGSGSAGGTGTGGERSGIFTNSGGEITLDQFFAFAQGRGGDGTTLVGGDGIGGQAFMGFQGGTTQINGDVITDASGFGGRSESADGGNGTGGVADIAVFSPIFGTGTITGHAQIFANGIGGGGGEGATGGVGTGGEAFIQAQAGGLVSVGSAQVNAIGQGGTGAEFEDDGIITTFTAAGGDGFGGVADIRAFDTGSRVVIERNVPSDFLATLSQATLLSASGFGGNATGGSGIGGNGTGGEAVLSATTGASVELSLDPANDPDPIGFIRIHSRGRGGNSSVEGGVGGQAISGLGMIEVDGGSVSMGATVFSMFAQGGNSLDQNLNITGGDAFGGERVVSVTNGGTLTAELSGGVSGAVGGNGSGTGNGGDATGGTVEAVIDNATFNMVGRNIFVDQSTGGNGAVGGSVTGGTVDFTAIGATLNFTPNAAGLASVAIGGFNTGGVGVSQGGDAEGATVNVLISESDWNGGSFTANATALGGEATGPTGIGGNALAGEVFFVGTSSTINVVGENLIEADAFGGAGATGGNAAAGFASVDLLDTNLNIATDGGNVSALVISGFADGGSGDQNGNATGGTAQLLMADASLIAEVVELDSSADAAATVANGLGGRAIGDESIATIEGNSVLDVTNLIMQSDATTSIGETAFGGDVNLNLGAPSGGAPLVDVVNLDISTDAIGGENSGPANFSGRFRINVTSGDLVAVNFGGTSLGEQNGEQGISSLIARGGDILIVETMAVETSLGFDIETGLGSIIGGPDQLDPTAVISVETQGRINILGDDDNVIGFGGALLNLASRDIVIEDGARIGAFTMNFVSLNEDAPAILGGGGTPFGGATGEGYSLIAEELGRLEVGSFNFVQPTLISGGVNDPDLILRDLTAFGSLDDGVSNIIVAVSGSGGVARVEGQVVVADAALSDTFSLFAEERIEIVTPGGIALLNPDNLPSGNIFLGSNNIWIADSDMIALLQDDPTFTGRNDQLAVAASGSDDPLGYLRAGGVVLEVGQSLLVRNTGTDTAQGGILVGDGGLTIRGTSGTELDVFAYGARIDAAGNLIVGEAFFDEVVFDDGTGSTLYSAESEFNDCLINTSDCGTTVDPDPDPDPEPEPEPEPEPDPDEEKVEEQAAVVNNPSVIEAAVATTQPVQTTEQESNDDFGFDFPGLVSEPENEDETEVDDPVAAGGDASLYSQGNIGTVRVEDN